LTTQYLDEAERLADRIVVIDRGKVIARGTASELKSRSGGERVEIRLRDRDQLGLVRPLLDGYAVEGMAETVEHASATVTVPVHSSDGVVPAVVRALDANGIEVADVVVRRPTLDDVFLQLTGHRVDPGENEQGPEPTGQPVNRGAGTQ
jgi:ABC-2 type transport system ATP-binding protein